MDGQIKRSEDRWWGKRRRWWCMIKQKLYWTHARKMFCSNASALPAVTPHWSSCIVKGVRLFEVDEMNWLIVFSVCWVHRLKQNTICLTNINIDSGSRWKLLRPSEVQYSKFKTYLLDLRFALCCHFNVLAWIWWPGNLKITWPHWTSGNIKWPKLYLKQKHKNIKLINWGYHYTV